MIEYTAKNPEKNLSFSRIIRLSERKKCPFWEKKSQFSRKGQIFFSLFFPEYIYIHTDKAYLVLQDVPKNSLPCFRRTSATSLKQNEEKEVRCLCGLFYFWIAKKWIVPMQEVLLNETIGILGVFPKICSSCIGPIVLRHVRECGGHLV